MREIRIEINGSNYTSRISDNLTLLDFIREEAGMSGTKRGCDSGHCGSCTVLLEGRPVYACITLAIQAEGKKVTTVEGLEGDAAGQLHYIQQAFIDHYGIQCGFCTPGMLMVAAALLEEKPLPETEDIKAAISGNLCRCTGYTNIVHSIRMAAEDKLKQEGGDE